MNNPKIKKNEKGKYYLVDSDAAKAQAEEAVEEVAENV
jgi:hypothetical protein